MLNLPPNQPVTPALPLSFCTRKESCRQYDLTHTLRPMKSQAIAPPVVEVRGLAHCFNAQQLPHAEQIVASDILRMDFLDVVFAYLISLYHSTINSSSFERACYALKSNSQPSK